MDTDMEIWAPSLQAGTEGGGMSGDDEDDNPIRLALNNPLILQQIFSHIGFRQVKVVRWVCKAWEAEGSTLLGEQSHFPLHRLFNSYQTTDPEMDVNPKLMQSVSIRPYKEIFKGIDMDGRHNVATSCLGLFASMWHSDVHELNVGLDVQISVDLPGILNAHDFPNLTKISIRIMVGVYYPNLHLVLRLRTINTLKELKVMGRLFRKGFSYDLLQNLINSAQNLEVLEIEGNFYPSLASCRKIRVLKLIGNTFNELLGGNEGWRDIELDQVFRMLNDIGNQLVDFTAVFEPIANFDVDMCFPKLSKLKSLSLNGVDIMKVVEKICPALLPRLETVSLRDGHLNEFLEMSSIKKTSYLTHEGVTSLELVDVTPDLISGASKRFPNVNRLVIRIGEEEDWDPPKGSKEYCRPNEIEPKRNFLGAILEACSIWKLLYLKVKIPRGLRLSDLLEGLKLISLLEGLKQVKIDFLPYCLNYDDISEKLQAFEPFEELFQLSAKMDRMVFKNLTLNPAMMEKVVKYLREHKDLPVFYLD